MAKPPPHTGFDFPGTENLRKDIYPAISAAETPSLRQPGKVVLITGASRGIGQTIALQYAHANVACLVLCARSASHLAEVEKKINDINASVRVRKFAIDVTSEADVQKCAEDVTAEEGRLDVMINNAGTSSAWVPLAEGKPSEWWQTIEVNIKGPYLMLHSFIPLLLSTAKEHGIVPDVINLSSIGAHMSYPGESAYGISKLAVLRLTEYITLDYGDQAINAISLHPGGVPTDLGLSTPTIKPCKSYRVSTQTIDGDGWWADNCYSPGRYS